MIMKKLAALALTGALSLGAALAQTNPGTSPLTVVKGGTGAATAAGARTSLGLVIGTNVQAYDPDLAAIAGLTTAADKCQYWTGAAAAALIDCKSWVRSFIAAADASAGRTSLGVAIGSDVQAYDPDLAALAGLTSANNKCFYWTGSGTAANYDCSSFGRGVSNAADATALRVLAGTVINTDVQAYDADLAALAGLTSANNKCFYWTGSGTAANYDCSSFGRGLANIADAAAGRTSLGVVIGTNVQAYHAALTALSADIADDQVFVGSGANAGTWKTVPDCTDSGGNHLNYTQSTNTFNCGTSVSGGGAGGNPAEPQGRLTLVTGTPVMTSTQSAKTSVFYTPYKGLYFPDPGNSFAMTSISSEITLALDSNSGHTGYQQSGKLFDLFLVNDAGTKRLCSGPAWTNDTTRASAVSYSSGFLTNTSGSMTCRFGSGSGDTVTCGAAGCLLVGTMRASADGQTEHVLGGAAAGGTAGSFLVWNLYNRVPVAAMVRDTTDSWTYAVANTWRAPNGSATMRVSAVRGLDEDAIYAQYNSRIAAGTSADAAAGIGLSSTTAFSGATGVSGSSSAITMSATYVGLMGQGYQFVSAIEFNTNTNASTWFGDNGTAYIQTGLSVTLRQ